MNRPNNGENAVQCSLSTTNLEQARELWAQASKIYQPDSLVKMWKLRMEAHPSPEEFIRDLKRFARSLKVENAKIAASYAVCMMEGFVQRFERMAVAGILDDALPKSSGLPVLYSPEAGVGATRWKDVHDFYIAKRIGTASVLEYPGLDHPMGGSPPWRFLAHDALFAVQKATLELSGFRKLRELGEPIFDFKRSWKGAEKYVGGNVFVLPGNELLSWPDWLDACERIPLQSDGRNVPIGDAIEEYVHAVRALVDHFFADTNNPYADGIVEKVRGIRCDLTRPRLVAEVRKNVLKTVRRMGRRTGGQKLPQ